MKRALITGITGQDGSYLAELLLSKGYEVHGIIRRASTFNTTRIDHVFSDLHEEDTRLFLHYGDLSDSEQISTIIYKIVPYAVHNPSVSINFIYEILSRKWVYWKLRYITISHKLLKIFRWVILLLFIKLDRCKKSNTANHGFFSCKNFAGSIVIC